MSNPIYYAGRAVRSYAETGEVYHSDYHPTVEYGLDEEIAVRMLNNVLKARHTGNELEHSGIINRNEQRILTEFGFSKEYVEELAGPNGTRPLEEREKWLNEHPEDARKRWFEPTPNDVPYLQGFPSDLREEMKGRPSHEIALRLEERCLGGADYSRDNICKDRYGYKTTIWLLNCLGIEAADVQVSLTLKGLNDLSVDDRKVPIPSALRVLLEYGFMKEENFNDVFEALVKTSWNDLWAELPFLDNVAEPARPWLKEIFKNSSDLDEVWTALTLLRCMGALSKDMLPALRRRAAFGSTWLKLQMLEALDAIGPEPEDAGILTAILFNDDGTFGQLWDGKEMAISLLKRLDLPEVRKDMVKALSDGKNLFPSNAADALAELGFDFEDIPAVVKFLGSERYVNNETYKGLLEKLAGFGSKAVPVLVDMYDGYRGPKTRIINGTLARMGDVGLLAMLDIVNEPDNLDQFNASTLLSDMDMTFQNPDAVSKAYSIIAPMIGDERAYVRCHAASYLRFVKDHPPAVTGLTALLSDSDAEVRLSALNTIYLYTFPRDAIPILEYMAKNDPNSDCRNVAGRVLDSILAKVE